MTYFWQEITFLLLWAAGLWQRRKTALNRSASSDSWQSLYGSQGVSVCVGSGEWKKASESSVFSLADRNALHPAHEVFSAMLALHSLLLPKCPTHMQVLTVAKMFALTVLSRAAALLCRQTNSLSFLQCVRPPKQRGLAEPSRLLQLVFTGVQSGCDPAPAPRCFNG